MRIKRNIWVLIGIVLMLAMFLPQGVTADLMPPCRLKGTVQVDGNWVTDGTPVTAWIADVVTTWNTTTFTYQGMSVYYVDILPDDPGTSIKDGGVEGDTVRFIVRWNDTNYPVLQTGTWELGMFVEVNLTVDTTIPIATLSGQPTGVVNYTTANITVDGTGVVAYKYKLDTGTWSDETPVSTIITLSGLSEGSHRVYAIGKDATDNWQPEAIATATDAWVVDTTPPTTPTLISPLNNARLSSTTPTFYWSNAFDANGVASYALQIDDNADFSSPIRNLTGLAPSPYTLLASEALPAGGYYWKVKAIDNAGNEGSWSDAWLFMVDIGVQTPLLQSPLNEARVKTPTPTFVWSTTETGVTYTLQIGNSDFSDITLNKASISALNYTLTTSEGLPDGIYYWHVKTVKGGQESGWSVIWSFTIDTKPPVATLIGAPSGIVNYNTANIAVDGIDVVAYKYKLDTGSWSTETPISVNITLSGLGDGLHTVYVIGKDTIGMWQAEANATTASWTVDTTPPTATLSGQPTGMVNYMTANITVDGTDVVAYKYKLDTGSWSAERMVDTTIVLLGLSEGTHTVYVIGKDTAGNWQAEASATTASWTIDTAPPTATLSGQPTGLTNHDTTNITVGGTDVVAYQYKLDTGNWSAETLVSTHITLSGLSDGPHVLYVIGKDAAGNWQAKSDATEAGWTVDATPPQAPILLSPDNNAKIKEKNPDFEWQPVSDLSGVSYRLEVANNTNFSSPEIAVSGIIGSNYAAIKSLSDNKYYWRVKAVDGAGNESPWSETWSFKVSTGIGWWWIIILLVLLAAALLAALILLRRRPRTPRKLA